MQAGKATAKAQVGDAEKGKVHTLMALLNQKTAMAAMNAEPLALDPHGRDNQLTVAGDPSPEFTICFAEDGSLKVDCRLVASDNDAAGPATRSPSRSPGPLRAGSTAARPARARKNR